jgi:hypothetical protein
MITENYLETLNKRRRNVMRKMKMTLNDGKDYTFTTLSCMEQQVMQDYSEDVNIGVDKTAKKEQQYLSLMESGKLDEAVKYELTIEESKKLKESNKKQLSIFAKSAVVSLAKVSDDFKVSEKNPEDKLINKILSITDMRDLKRIYLFVMTGSLVKEEDNDITYTEIIDLTVKK